MSDSKSLRDMTPQELDAMVGRITDIVMQELGSRQGGPSGGPTVTTSPGGVSIVHAQGPAHSAPRPVASPAPISATERMSLPPGTTPNQCAPVSDFIDHTLLKPDATEDEVRAICAEARDNKFASVCVNGAYVDLVAAELKGSGVKTCAVVGFPLGAMTSTAKAYEAADLIKRGADEIDMVINVGKLKSRDYSGTLDDIAAVRAATRGATLKVILETSLLDDEEKRAGCVLSKAAGADFVKTSTGFGGGGATAEDIALMRRVVGPKMGVKASGGIRTCDDALAMIASGATRLGASAGVKIVKGEKTGGSGY